MSTSASSVEFSPTPLFSAVVFDHLAAAEEKRKYLVGAVEWLELIAGLHLRNSALPGPGSRLPLPGESRWLAKLFGVSLFMLRSGLLADELAIYASDLLPRYASALDVGLDRLQDLVALFSAFADEEDAIARGDTSLEATLERATRDPKPRSLDLGSFEEFAEDE